MTVEKGSDGSDLNMDIVCAFAGHLAHELNNLLTPIIACGQMLKDGLDEEHPQYFCAEQIFDAGERCLAFSRKLQIIGSRRSSAHAVNLASLSHEAVRSIKMPPESAALIDASGIPSPDGSGDAPLVMVDPEQFVFLVTELAENAAAFMPNGGTVQFSVTEHDVLEGHEGTGWSCLSVRDEGSGMDEETQAHMYEPYFSTVGKTREKGLGLTLVYGIVRRAGGVIQCESSPGAGTIFHLYFPHTSPVAED